MPWAQHVLEATAQCQSISQNLLRLSYPDSMLLVPNITSSNRWMIANLFGDQIRCPTIINPFSQEYFSQTWIQRLHAFLFTIFVLVVVLLPQCAQKPFQNQQRPLLGVFFFAWGDEEAWMLCPIRAEFDN